MSPPVLMHVGLLCITFRLSGVHYWTKIHYSSYSHDILYFQYQYVATSLAVKGLRSNKGSKQRRVGSHQPQVAFFYSALNSKRKYTLLDLSSTQKSGQGKPDMERESDSKSHKNLRISMILIKLAKNCCSNSMNPHCRLF